MCCSPVRYTVDDFGFEEKGAVLGCADEFVNHSRLWGAARESGKWTDCEGLGDGDGAVTRTWWWSVARGGLIVLGTPTTCRLYPLTHATGEPAHSRTNRPGSPRTIRRHLLLFTNDIRAKCNMYKKCRHK